MTTLDHIRSKIQKAKGLVKGPPGQVPDHYTSDVIWDDDSSHWVLPEVNITPNRLRIIEDHMGILKQEYKTGNYKTSLKMLKIMMEILKRGMYGDDDASPVDIAPITEKLENIKEHILGKMDRQFEDLKGKGRAVSHRGMSRRSMDSISHEVTNRQTVEHAKPQNYALMEYTDMGYESINSFLRDGEGGAYLTIDESDIETMYGSEDTASHFKALMAEHIIAMIQYEGEQNWEQVESAMYGALSDIADYRYDGVLDDEDDENSVDSNFLDSVEMYFEDLKQEIATAKIPTMIQDIDKHMEPLKDDRALYRGISSSPDLVVGDVYSPDAYMSTSRDPITAMEFAEGETLLEIHVTPETYGIVLDTQEHETILGYAQNFRVKEIREEQHLEDDMYVTRYMILEYVDHNDPQYTTWRMIKAGPPGPAPAPHLKWKDETRRWVCRNNKCAKSHWHSDGHDIEFDTMEDILDRAEESAYIKKVRRALDGVIKYTKKEDWDYVTQLLSLMREPLRRAFYSATLNGRVQEKDELDLLTGKLVDLGKWAKHNKEEQNRKEIDMENWEPNIKFSGRADGEMEYATKLAVDKFITAFPYKAHQDFIKRSISKRGITIHSKASFRKHRSIVGARQRANSQILGLTDETGVHLSAEDYSTDEFTREHVIIHEIGHQIHVYDLIDQKLWDGLLDIYRKKRRISEVVSSYAGTNYREYVAECMAYYILHPKKLQAADPSAYVLLHNIFGKK